MRVRRLMEMEKVVRMDQEKLNHFRSILLNELKRHTQNVADEQAMAQDGAGSPIRRPRNAVAVERCPGHRKALWRRDPRLRGRKIRSGRDLPEMTKAGGTSRHSPAALCRSLPVSPENREARADLLRSHREATPGRL